MKQIPILTAAEVTHAYSTKKQDYWSGYLAMYSSWLGGITKDPAFMQVPVDDHMVHRGDGVFEAIKTINGKVFLFHEHLDRLEKSAAQLLLPIPFPRKELESIVLETLRAAGEPNALIRLYVSRGPGGFTTNPYECVSSQLYIVVTKFKPIAAEKYLKGVKVAISKIPIKDPWFARVKSRS
ncbi:MAG: aminotransferase class IV, partial [Pseudobdellovibrionaceae bacterium]